SATRSHSLSPANAASQYAGGEPENRRYRRSQSGTDSGRFRSPRQRPSRYWVLYRMPGYKPSNPDIQTKERSRSTEHSQLASGPVSSIRLTFTGLKGKNSIARGCQPLARPSPDLMLTAPACNTSVIL